MTRYNQHKAKLNIQPIFLAAFTLTLITGVPLIATDPPPELSLWDEQIPPHAFASDGEEQVRVANVQPESPSGLNRAFSAVSSPAYCIHQPEIPNGVGLVICPGGGFRDVWIDREGHDLALFLKAHGVTSLVLKYRTRSEEAIRRPGGWEAYQQAVQADGRQAIRVLRENADELGLNSEKIGICGFSAGGYLSISCSLPPTPETSETSENNIDSAPNFVGLFYPGIPEDARETLELLASSEENPLESRPFFIVNARNDEITPVDKCLEFYIALLNAEANAELHVYNRGGHGFSLGVERGESTAMWPHGFVSWLKDCNIIEN
jgi:acetyl esterase/lipase